MAYLILEDGQIRPLALDERPALIGRNPANEIVIRNNVSVSREHARIRQSEQKILLEDCGSRNGTSLNGRRLIEPKVLRDGDEIEICGHRLRYRQESSIESTDSVSNESDRLQSIRIEPGESHLSSVMAQFDVAADRFSESAGAHRKLRTLIEIARALSSTLQLQEILDKILDCLFELFDQADRGFVILNDEHGNPVPHAMKLRGDRRNPDIHVLSRTIVDEVVKSGQALLSRDATNDSRFAEGESIAQLDLRSIMCAPLMDADHQAIGLIQLDSLRPAIVFHNDDLELLSTVAIQGGLAIANSRLVEEMVEAATLKKDLQLAHRVQQSFLPEKRPKLPEYEFYDYYKAANDVGGDFFDYVPMEDGKLAIIIADVVGHGVAAALLMAKLAADTQVAIKTEGSLSRVMKHLNEKSQRFPPDKFVTMVIAVLDTEQHKLQVSNAGHMQPLVRRSDGTIFRPDEEWSDVPLGVLKESDFPEYTIDLDPGDLVLMFTDGLNESVNEADEEYSIDRVIQQLKAAADPDPVMVAGGIISDMQQFTGQSDPFDDVCVVAFGRSHNQIPELHQQASPAPGEITMPQLE